MSSEGQPIQVNPTALQSMAAQTSFGRSSKISQTNEQFGARIANKLARIGLFQIIQIYLLQILNTKIMVKITIVLSRFRYNLFNLLFV